MLPESIRIGLMRKFFPALIVGIFVVGFLVRLYRFDNPVADWHGFRQGDTNAVSAIFSRDGINFLMPRYFDISNVASGQDNPQGLRFVEFPIMNAVQVSLFKLFGGLTLVEWGRMVSIIASLVSAFFIWLIVRKYANETVGFLASFFFLFLPFSIFYSRAILPESSTAAAILGGIYFFDKWIERSSKYRVLSSKYLVPFILSIILTALAFLLKPYALFFTLPIVYLAFQKFGLKIIKQWQLWLFAVLTILPLVLWRMWISHFPEGVPASDWLFNGNSIRFRPSFFRWIFYERITRLILGYVGAFFLVEGLFWLVKHKNGFFFSFLLSSIIYLSVIATGNVQHDYYQVLILPTISIFAGLGVTKLFGTLSKAFNKSIAVTICVLLISLSFYFSWKQVRDFFNINDRTMVETGRLAASILPKDAVIIAPYDGSTMLLNIAERPGWIVFQNSIEELIKKGATHLVITRPTQSDFDGFGRKYMPLASSSSSLILKLK